jgi:hypothetical protein
MPQVLVLLLLLLLQVFTVTVPPAQVEAAKQFVQQQLSANARLTYSVGGTLKYELPTSEVRSLLCASNKTVECQCRAVAAAAAAITQCTADIKCGFWYCQRHALK